MKNSSKYVRYLGCNGKLGFNEGFKEGDAFGKCLGIINASIK